jgi:hypothetical protein
LRGQLPGEHGEVRALAVQRIDELGRVTDHDGAVGEDLRQPVVAAFRNEVP